MYYVYVLWSEKLQKRYIGSTDDIDQRLIAHNSGKTPFTRRGMPWVVIHREELETLSEARRRERFLKSGIGRKWLDMKYPKYRRGARAVE
ncbi:MAG: GIY-YIG nuclease family protein [Bacteroidota bacterium]|jgi:putative endonuclease